MGGICQRSVAASRVSSSPTRSIHNLIAVLFACAEEHRPREPFDRSFFENYEPPFSRPVSFSLSLSLLSASSFLLYPRPRFSPFYYHSSFVLMAWLAWFLIVSLRWLRGTTRGALLFLFRARKVSASLFIPFTYVSTPRFKNWNVPWT